MSRCAFLGKSVEAEFDITEKETILDTGAPKVNVMRELFIYGISKASLSIFL